MRLLVFTILMFSLWGTAGAGQVSGPKIAADELRHDLGRLEQGAPGSHVFEIRNEGAETLIVERIQSC